MKSLKMADGGEEVGAYGRLGFKVWLEDDVLDTTDPIALHCWLESTWMCSGSRILNTINCNDI